MAQLVTHTGHQSPASGEKASPHDNGRQLPALARHETPLLEPGRQPADRGLGQHLAARSREAGPIHHATVAVVPGGLGGEGREKGHDATRQSIARRLPGLGA